VFFHADIKGADLPPQTLCLTYDDGPGETNGIGAGPRTSELGRFLHAEHIQATFFIIGQHAQQYPYSLAQLSDQGHLIGNHTYSHPGLVALAEADGNLVEEIARTDELIRPYSRGRSIFFRPPYGNWRQEIAPGRDREHSIVAERLNASGLFQHYLGPVNWDISGEDYDYWRAGASAAAAAERYLREIEQAGRGIVLMHDSSDEEIIRNNNCTFELTQLLVPELKRPGYRFVPLTEVPVGWDQRAKRAPAHHNRRAIGGPAAAAALSHPTITRARTLADDRTRLP